MANYKSKKESECKAPTEDTWLPTKSTEDSQQVLTTCTIKSAAEKILNKVEEQDWCKKLHTFFASSLPSTASITFGSTGNGGGSTSPYATISRRKVSRQNSDLGGYYELFCGGNDSVSSLPLPKTVDSALYESKLSASASMPKLGTLPFASSSAGDSLPPVFEEEIFSFLDDYDKTIHTSDYQDYNDYFLPNVKEDTALKKWEVLEASGNYEQVDFKDEFCARPKCLNIGDEKVHCGSNSSQCNADVIICF